MEDDVAGISKRVLGEILSVAAHNCPISSHLFQCYAKYLCFLIYSSDDIYIIIRLYLLSFKLNPVSSVFLAFGITELKFSV